jgi:hypothetical protein
MLVWAANLTQNGTSKAGLVLTSVIDLHNFSFHFYISCRESLPMGNNYFIQNLIVWNFGILLPECFPTLPK